MSYPQIIHADDPKKKDKVLSDEHAEYLQARAVYRAAKSASIASPSPAASKLRSKARKALGAAQAAYTKSYSS